MTRHPAAPNGSDISVILTVVGNDRPGLTQAIADAVLAARGNWLQSHLSKLGGRYVGSVLVELPEQSLHALERGVRDIDARGLSITIIPASEDTSQKGEYLQLAVVGQDQPGIVREVTSALAELGVNIEDFETRAEHSSWSGQRLFRATANLLVPLGVSIEDVQEALERISGEIMVDINISPPADIHTSSQS